MFQPSRYIKNRGIMTKTPHSLTIGWNVIEVHLGREVFDAKVLLDNGVDFGYRLQDWASPELAARLGDDAQLIQDVKTCIWSRLQY